MGLSFVEEGPFSGGPWVDAHAATACLRVGFLNSETGKHLDRT